MRPVQNDSSRPAEPVLMIGPPADSIGGIATVANQMAGLTYCGRYRAAPLFSTRSTRPGEPILSRLRRHLGQAGAVRRAVRRDRCRLVHIHTCSGVSFLRSAIDLFAARRLGCRVVLHVHGAAFDEFYNGSSAVVQRFVRVVLARADRVIALSSAWRDVLRTLSPRAEVVVVENAVAGPASLPERAAGPICRFLFLSRLDEWKGVDDLLDAAVLCADRGSPVELILAGPPGSAGDADVIARKIRQRHADKFVRYVGPVVGRAKNEQLAAADAFIQPSHHEGMPISVLEAMSYGLPIVATTVGALPELIGEGREGLLVPPRRPDLLAGAMGRLAAHAEVRRLMGHNARQRAESRFSIQRFERDLTRLYDGLSRQAASGAAPPGRRLRRPLTA